MQAVDEMCGGNLHVLYGQAYSPPRVRQKLQAVLGERAIPMSGEKYLGPRIISNYANAAVRVVYQPGVWSQIRRTRPDVLIGEGFFQWTSFALAYRILRDVPLVVCYERTFHTERNAQWFRLAYRRLAMRFIGAMCCNGKLCVDYTRFLGMPLSRITTGHMVADTEGLSAQARAVTEPRRQQLRQAWNSRGLVFLYVGRLIPLKGLSQFLEGWALLERSLPHAATLVIVGEGPEEQNLRSQASQLGLTGVRFAGAVDYDQLAPYYAASDAFVIPTLEDNWSLVVPEAMACGLPILCSKYNGCWPELVHDRNGWVFDPLDAQNILARLRQCLSAQADLKDMGEQSRQIVAGHTPDVAARSIYDACQIALERGPWRT
jgi:glycosyltransferase involved in cell wall biosynthesis